MKRKTTKAKRKTILRQYKQLVERSAEAEDEYVRDLPTKLALEILRLFEDGPGRPCLYDLPFLEDIYTENWILSRADELARAEDERRGKERGQHGWLAIKAAEAELFEQRYTGTDKLNEPGAFDSFRQTLRRKRRAARDGIQALMEIDDSEIKLPPDGRSLREIGRPLHDIMREYSLKKYAKHKSNARD